MKREQKAEVVEQIAAQISNADAIYAVDYRGLSVPQAASLRASLREADASFRIVKNTLTLLAADKAKADDVKALIQGPTAFTFVRGDAALAAKTLDSFARREQVLEVRGGLLNGELLSAERFREFARLPAREQLNAQFAAVVAAPLTGLIRGLGSLLSGLAVALGQVREKRQADEPAPAQEESPPEPESQAEAEPAEAGEAEEKRGAPAEGEALAEGEAPAEADGSAEVEASAEEEAPPEGEAPSSDEEEKEA